MNLKRRLEEKLNGSSITRYWEENGKIDRWFFFWSVVLAPTYVGSFFLGFLRPNHPRLWGFGMPVFMIIFFIIYTVQSDITYRATGVESNNLIGLVPIFITFLTLWYIGVSYLGASIRKRFFKKYDPGPYESEV